MGTRRRAERVLAASPGSRVTRLELFYDLVFVFAFLNVTTVLSETLGPPALLAGLVVLALLWWCWVSFAALGNLVRADQGVVPLVGAATVAALLVLSMSLPGAGAGGVGVLVFALCYLVIRGLQAAVLTFYSRARGGPVWLPILPVLAATGLIALSALVPTLTPDRWWAGWLRLGLWATAAGVEFLAGALAHHRGFTVLSAGHWAERYALIVLVALGESIIALGVGPGLTIGLPLALPAVVAAVLGVAVISALWWLYFDVLAPALEQQLHRTREPRTRALFARDVYTHLHLALIAGVILFALGLKLHLAAVGKSDSDAEAWGVRAPGLAPTTLFGGVAIYLGALVALVWRGFRRVRTSLVVALVLAAALIPLLGRAPATVGLGVLAALCVGLVLVGLRPDDTLRREVRRLALEEQQATERDQSEWRRHHL